MGAEESVYLKGKIECRTVCGHRDDVAFRGKDEYLGGKEVELYGIEEIHRIRLWVVENLLDSLQPAVEFVLSNLLGIHRVGIILILPMGSKALLGNVVHVGRTYLHLYPLSLFTHEGYM